jgi:PBSX family phage terminase large subunit
MIGKINFNEKHSDFLKADLAPFNLLKGAIRSGKTVSSMYKYIFYLMELKAPYKHGMAGKTLTTLKRNVLDVMTETLTTLGITYNLEIGNQELHMNNQRIYLLGLNDEKSEGKVKGLTLKSAYVDEMSECNQNGFNTLLDRLSLDDSVFIGTTNPKSKHHWLEQEYFQKLDMINNGTYRIWHFRLWDNINLPKKYITNLINRYPEGTVNYNRKILGLASNNEGLIYTGFTMEENTFNTPRDKYISHCLSTDYGSSNVSVIGYFGIHYHKRNEYAFDLLDEYYYDATHDGNYTLTDEELIDNAVSYFHDHGYRTDKYSWFVPHDASSLKTSLLRRGKNAITYTPQVLEDIQVINSYLHENKFRIHKDNCPDSLTQIQDYSWDPKKQSQGVDAPLKVNDHACDMFRGAIIGTIRYGYYNPIADNDTYTPKPSTRFRPTYTPTRPSSRHSLGG